MGVGLLGRLLAAGDANDAGGVAAAQGRDCGCWQTRLAVMSGRWRWRLVVMMKMVLLLLLRLLHLVVRRWGVHHQRYGCRLWRQWLLGSSIGCCSASHLGAAADLPAIVVIVVVVVGIVEHWTGCSFPLSIQRYGHRLWLLLLWLLLLWHMLLLLLLLLRLIGDGSEKVLPMTGGDVHRRVGDGIQRRGSGVVHGRCVRWRGGPGAAQRHWNCKKKKQKLYSFACL